jgi:undecaprenyl-diphosphatase
MGRSSQAAPALGQALWLGLAHGPTELLPVSSSGHVTLIGWFAGWSYAELDLAVRKDFEVALHAGTAAALLIGLRARPAGWAVLRDRRSAVVLALAIGPPALAGLVLERRIERLGTPAGIARGLLLGSCGLAAAERWGRVERGVGDAGPLDGLLLGLAQAAALMPGISRNGATLTVARARGFGREAADRLSRECGLAVIGGAVALRAVRGRRARGAPVSGNVAGAAAAFVSTLVAERLLARRERPVSLLACAAYRAALAGLIGARLRSPPAGAAGNQTARTG